MITASLVNRIDVWEKYAVSAYHQTFSKKHTISLSTLVYQNLIANAENTVYFFKTNLLGRVVQSPTSANPGLTLNKTYGVNPGLALIGL